MAYNLLEAFGWQARTVDGYYVEEHISPSVYSVFGVTPTGDEGENTSVNYFRQVVKKALTDYLKVNFDM